jgi:hypothetical protein
MRREEAELNPPRWLAPIVTLRGDVEELTEPLFQKTRGKMRGPKTLAMLAM